MGLFNFKKYREDVINTFGKDIEKEEPKEEVKEETMPVEEWIWVDGYKATDKDMKCRDYQYEFDKVHTMPEGSSIVECESGFHLCKNLKDVFEYYEIGDNHRFFKVKALVRKSDYDRYGGYNDAYLAWKNSPVYYSMPSKIRQDKLVASSIIFERELTLDEIFEQLPACRDWDVKYEEMALVIGIDRARTNMRADTLVNLGYSETFARDVVGRGKYEIAAAVGSLPDLSMDMKVWTIFNS
jgi:hypothetical protein